MDDITLISVGRTMTELSIQREQLFRALQEANKRIADLESQLKNQEAKPSEPVEGVS